MKEPRLPLRLRLGWIVFRIFYYLLKWTPRPLRRHGPLRKYFWQPEEIAQLAEIDGQGVFCIEAKTGIMWQSTDTIQ